MNNEELEKISNTAAKILIIGICTAIAVLVVAGAVWCIQEMFQ